MVVFPNAKINLGLDILSKRDGGYHNISSAFYPLPLQDVLEIIPSETLQFDTSGLKISGNPENNLILKAYQLLQREFDIPPVHIHLHKIIPMGAGLGGGSSDAAFTIKLLNNLFSLSLSDSKLESLAGQLGSDCPFFIRNKPILAEGTGTEFSDIALDLSGKYLVLICPNIHVGTAEAYQNVKPAVPEHTVKEIIEDTSIDRWRNSLKNDFEASIFSKYPQLKNIKQQLYAAGALYASMSGSGSSIYGIFDNEPSSLSIADICWKGTL